MAHAHLRYLSPFPRNLGEILKKYKRVLVPELNLGQLRMLLANGISERSHRLQQDQRQAV